MTWFIWPIYFWEYEIHLEESAILFQNAGRRQHWQTVIHLPTQRPRFWIQLITKPLSVITWLTITRLLLYAELSNGTQLSSHVNQTVSINWFFFRWQICLFTFIRITYVAIANYPRPTRCGGDIVTLLWFRPSVHPSMVPSVHGPCENDRDYNVAYFFVNFGRHVNHDERMNPIDFGGQRSKVKVTMDIYGNKLVNTIVTTLLHISLSNLANMLTTVRGWTLLIFEAKGQGHYVHIWK